MLKESEQVCSLDYIAHAPGNDSDAPDLAEVLRPARRMAAQEARSVTDRIKASDRERWSELVAIYEGCGHLALGYRNWHEYYYDELGHQKTYAYDQLNAGFVVREIATRSAIAERPSVVSHTKVLARMLATPAAMVDLWGKRRRSGRPRTATA